MPAVGAFGDDVILFDATAFAAGLPQLDRTIDIDMKYGQFPINGTGDLTIGAIDPDIGTVFIDAKAIASANVSRNFFVNQPGDDIVFRQLTLTHGNAVNGDGGGILILDANVKFEKCEISSTIALGRGAGIAIFAGSLHLTETTLSGNPPGVPPYPLQGGNIYSATSVVTDGGSKLHGGRAEYGGAIYIDAGGSLDMVDTAIANSKADYSGAGIYILGSSTAPSVQYSIRNSNLSDLTAFKANGGGIAITGGGTLVLEDVQIKRGDAFHRGGGIDISISEARDRASTSRASSSSAAMPTTAA